MRIFPLFGSCHLGRDVRISLQVLFVWEPREKAKRQPNMLDRTLDKAAPCLFAMEAAGAQPGNVQGNSHGGNHVTDRRIRHLAHMKVVRQPIIP